jgi:hypothetical protein
MEIARYHQPVLFDKPGNLDEACPIVADIYDWFSEGFVTADLKGREGAARTPVTYSDADGYGPYILAPEISGAV